MPTVLHVLPHRGGGAETYIDLLAQLDSFEHERVALSAGRTAAAAAASLPRCYPAIARAACRADLVHAHGDAAAMLALPLLVRRPSVWTTHGLHLLRRKPLVASGVRAAIRATRVTLCTSQTEHDELARLVTSAASRLVVVRNGLAPAAPSSAGERAAARAELGIAEGELVALFLGELEPRKGPLDAAATAQRVRAAGMPLTLLVAGDGPLHDAVADAGGDAVRMLGFRDDVGRLLAAADVFVLPSAREGLSFALLEAMRAGLAIVVADGPGNAEAIGATGVVVPAGDRAALATALTRLANDQAERARLGAAAQARIASVLTVEQLCVGVRAAYERALMAPDRDAGAASA